MANELITPQELATWTQTDLATVQADPFAAEVMTKVSDYVRWVGGKRTPEEWSYDTAPFDVKMIVLWMCRRTYVNPDQETDTGVGPIRSSVLDEAALAMNLSEAERATLAQYAADATGDTGLWVQPTTGGLASLPPTIYVADDSGSDWMIPYLDINDVGVQDSDVLATGPYTP